MRAGSRTQVDTFLLEDSAPLIRKRPTAQEAMETQMGEDRFLRIKEVVEKTTLSRTTIYRRIAEGSFPAPKRLSHRVSVWSMAAVDQWMEAAVGNQS